MLISRIFTNVDEVSTDFFFFYFDLVITSNQPQLQGIEKDTINFKAINN